MPSLRSSKAQLIVPAPYSGRSRKRIRKNAAGEEKTVDDPFLPKFPFAFIECMDKLYFENTVIKSCVFRFARMYLSTGDFMSSCGERPRIRISGPWVKYDPQMLNRVVAHQRDRHESLSDR